MKSLLGIIPVPHVKLFCNDPSVIGTPFFVYDFVEGELLTDEHLPGFSSKEKHSIYHELTRTLAR